jgi:predicted dehydrogenase
MYRTAIIGCGGRARMHALAYQLISRGRLVACCDRHADKRDAFAREFGITPYADAAEMLAREQPDLVHLVTGPASRVEPMALMSEAGTPACIVEKPLACQVADWKQLVELEARSRTKFALCHQFRWHADLARCREALRSGRLGRILFMDFSAGMNIAGQGTHLLDYAMSLNEDAPIVRVFGAAHGTKDMTDFHPGPDTTIAQVLFANGVYGMWNNGPTARRVGDPSTNWQHVRAAAYAERGHAYWEEFGQWEIFSPEGTQCGRTESMSMWEAGNHAAQAALTNAMFDWIEDDHKPAGTNLKLGLHQWQAVLALYASALWRRPVDLPFDPPDDLFLSLAQALKSNE